MKRGEGRQTDRQTHTPYLLVVHVVELRREVQFCDAVGVPPRRVDLNTCVDADRVGDAVQLAHHHGAAVEPQEVREQRVEAARDGPLQPVKGETCRRCTHVRVVMRLVAPAVPQRSMEEKTVQQVVVQVEDEEIHQKLPPNEAPIGRSRRWQRSDRAHLDQRFLQQHGGQPAHRHLHGLQPLFLELRVHREQARERELARGLVVPDPAASQPFPEDRVQHPRRQEKQDGVGDPSNWQGRAQGVQCCIDRVHVDLEGPLLDFLGRDQTAEQLSTIEPADTWWREARRREPEHRREEL